MTAIGFSTGAVSQGDFKQALQILTSVGCEVIELSALRDYELPALIQSLPELDLAGYRYISLHAPSAFTSLSELEVIRLLDVAASLNYPIVLHPDASSNLHLWRHFGPLLLVENMDKRKLTGRSVGELEEAFDKVPEARMCFDIAHARQVDPTMSQAFLMLKQFSSRVAQMHLSEVDLWGRHRKLTVASTIAYPRILAHISSDIPVVMESVIRPDEIKSELEFARRLCSSAERLDRHSAL